MVRFNPIHTGYAADEADAVITQTPFMFSKMLPVGVARFRRSTVRTLRAIIAMAAISNIAIATNIIRPKVISLDPSCDFSSFESIAANKTKTISKPMNE